MSFGTEECANRMAKGRQSGKSKQAGRKDRPAEEGYWNRTRLPVYSLAFVLPMVLFYEVGVLAVNRALLATHGYTVRNASDWLIRRAMDGIASLMGRPGMVMSGVFIAVVLVVWQVLSRRPWEVRLATLCGMLAESVLIAMPLALLAAVYLEPLMKMTIENGDASPFQNRLFADVVMSFGAGVYEEFIFRLVLVGMLAVVVHGIAGIGWRPAALVGIVLAALAFAGVHHLGEFGRPFTWTDFLFRTGAGLLFGAVYYLRGFGIAAGTHALYDVFYVLLVSAPGVAK